MSGDILYGIMEGRHVYFDREQAYEEDSLGARLVAVGKFAYHTFRQGEWSTGPLSESPAEPVEDVVDELYYFVGSLT